MISNSKVNNICCKSASLQRIIVETTEKSDHFWSAIFCVIVCIVQNNNHGHQQSWPFAMLELRLNYIHGARGSGYQFLGRIKYETTVFSTALFFDFCFRCAGLGSVTELTQLGCRRELRKREIFNFKLLVISKAAKITLTQ